MPLKERNIYESNCQIIDSNQIPLTEVFNVEDPSNNSPTHCKCNIKFESLTTSCCAIKYSELEYKVALLNFASEKRPGGGYKNGAEAQEESLCRSIPYLYPSLKQCQYPIKNKVLLTRDLLIMRDRYHNLIYNSPYNVDVITASAKSNFQNKLSLIFNVSKHCEILILGAWGCGAYKHDPYHVASLMMKACEIYGSQYEMVVFAIPNPELRAIFLAAAASLLSN